MVNRGQTKLMLQIELVMWSVASSFEAIALTKKLRNLEPRKKYRGHIIYTGLVATSHVWGPNNFTHYPKSLTVSTYWPREAIQWLIAGIVSG